MDALIKSMERIPKRLMHSYGYDRITKHWVIYQYLKNKRKKHWERLPRDTLKMH